MSEMSSSFLVVHSTAVEIWLFATTIVTFWTAEVFSLPTRASDKLRHTAGNALFILTALPIQLVMVTFCAAVSKWTAQHHWGLVYSTPNFENPLVKYGLMFLLLDFLDYVYHVIMHQVPAFWRFHRTHHMDRAVDVSTTVREHPGETFIRNCFLIFWVFLTGASIEILIIRQTAQTVMNLWSHMAIPLPGRSARILGGALVTPNWHHIHHHARLPFTDRNYGDVFIIWDRLFGTFAALPAHEIKFGLDAPELTPLVGAMTDVLPDITFPQTRGA